MEDLRYMSQRLAVAGAVRGECSKSPFAVVRPRDAQSGGTVLLRVAIRALERLQQVAVNRAGESLVFLGPNQQLAATDFRNLL